MREATSSHFPRGRCRKWRHLSPQVRMQVAFVGPRKPWNPEESDGTRHFSRIQVWRFAGSRMTGHFRIFQKTSTQWRPRIRSGRLIKPARTKRPLCFGGAKAENHLLRLCEIQTQRVVPTADRLTCNPPKSRRERECRRKIKQRGESKIHACEELVKAKKVKIAGASIVTVRIPTMARAL
jgi:hypothetical protein